MIISHVFPTGYAYYSYAGKIVAKIEIKPGTHPVDDKYTIFDVADKAALELVELPLEPVTKTELELRLEKIEADVTTLKAAKP